MKRASIACLAVFAVACGSLTSPEEQRQVGIVVGIHANDPHIEVPETVQAGQTFTVTVRTYGLSSCWRKDVTMVEVEDLEAVVTPVDVERTERLTACLAVVQSFSHTATLSFDSPGTAQVTIRGREPEGGVITLARMVVVE